MLHFSIAIMARRGAQLACLLSFSVKVFYVLGNYKSEGGHECHRCRILHSTTVQRCKELRHIYISRWHPQDVGYRVILDGLHDLLAYKISIRVRDLAPSTGVTSRWELAMMMRYAWQDFNSRKKSCQSGARSACITSFPSICYGRPRSWNDSGGA